MQRVEAVVVRARECRKHSLRRFSVFASVIAIAGGAMALSACAGAPTTLGPTPTASRGVLFGSDYSSGTCPSSSSASKALRKTVSLKSSKLVGYEFYCKYSGSAVAEINYTYNHNRSASDLKSSLAEAAGTDKLHRVPDTQDVAYEWASAREILVAGVAHGYTISVTSSGASVVGVDELERIAIQAWSN